MGEFLKHPEPIIKPNPDYTFHCPILNNSVQWQVQNVYNPAAVVKDGKVYLLFRADDKTDHKFWPRTCRTGLAWSEDGINFKIHPEPVLFPDNDGNKTMEWVGGVEDIHVIEGPDGVFYANYTAYNGNESHLCVATSRDLFHWTKHGDAFAQSEIENKMPNRTGVVVSELKDGRLVAKKINGKYWMYYSFPCALATSTDLINWEPINIGVSPWKHQMSHEAGAIALYRDDGILLMYNASSYPGFLKRGWQLGQVLVDKNDMHTAIEETKKPFLYPEKEWEVYGYISSTTVANGLAFYKGKWLLYYGGADRVIGLAIYDP
jgi:predicted GH43/DUF377 family glycosyl hydrolase